MADLSMIIVVASEHEGAPELRCDDHPDWWGDADAERLPAVIQRAIDHFREEHRVHVTGCVCRDRVTDGRCIPPLTLAGKA